MPRRNTIRLGGAYLTALVCKKGHVVTYRLEETQEACSAYCSTCGQETMSMCVMCKASVRGAHGVRESYQGWADSQTQLRYNALQNPQRAPSFCHNCGTPYPWTEIALNAVQELIEETDLSDEEKEKLKNNIADLISDTPRTQVAIMIVEKWLDKATVATCSAFKEILVNVASEVSKKSLGL